MKNKVGISLIVLIITIIIIVILAGTVILNLVQNNPIENAEKATILSDLDAFKSELAISIADKYSKNTELDLNKIDINGENNSLWQEYIPSIINKKINGEKYTKILEIKDGKLLFKTSEKEFLSDVTCGVIIDALDGNMSYPVIADGSWDDKKNVNSPKIEGTGLTPVYYNGSSWIELNYNSSKEEWNKWYDYSLKNWANAKSKDGSMWVWIPRYAYRITSGLYQNTNGKIDVQFVDIENKNGENIYSTIYPTVDTKSHKMNDYVIHPAFTTNLDNGGWDQELPGIWVAKYEAGFQTLTVGDNINEIINASDEKIYSDLNYTSYKESYKINIVGQDLTTYPKMLYPVFKSNTYSYNSLSVTDAFLLSKEIGNSDFYGLTNVDSHLMKNSEWGAITYLAYSIYGKNSEIGLNTMTVNDENNYTYIITGYGSNGKPSTGHESTTGNMTGIFDMAGGTWERVSGFYYSGKANDINWHLVFSNQEKSNKYITLYEISYQECKKYGDALKEVSLKNAGSYSWNLDTSYYPIQNNPIIVRGGNYSAGQNGGIFCYRI